MESVYEAASLEVQKTEAKLREIIGSDINYDSPLQLIDYFYGEKHLRPYVKKRKGGESTKTVDDKALQRIAGKGFIEAQLILDIRKLKKGLSTYYGMEIDEDKRFRCSFNPVGTVQERISSSATLRGTGGNAQNLPPGMRKLLCADPGYLLVSQDLGQAENRIVAYEAVE